MSSSDDKNQFVSRLEALNERIQAACQAAGRDRREVTLMAVTKTHGPLAVAMAAESGIACVGENHVQEAVAKQHNTSSVIRWELIGHLQSNKARMAVEHFDRIQSVDRAKLAQALNRHAEALGKAPLPILLQVNAGDDPAKYGVSCEAAAELADNILACSHLQLDGLMTIAPLSNNPEVARRCFRRLRELRERLQNHCGQPLPELSMGMTGDLEIAIAEGSTLIRVGTALFGARPAAT